MYQEALAALNHLSDLLDIEVRRARTKAGLPPLWIYTNQPLSLAVLARECAARQKRKLSAKDRKNAIAEIKRYLEAHPDARIREVHDVLGFSLAFIHKSQPWKAHRARRQERHDASSMASYSDPLKKLVEEQRKDEQQSRRQYPEVVRLRKRD